MQLTKEKLYNHHRLSHQQISNWIGDISADNAFSEKLMLMEEVREFLSVTDALQAADCQFIPMKGPLLSYFIYGDATCRRSRDLDFLVPFEEIEKIIPVFTQLGYCAQYYEWPKDEPSKEFKRKLRNQYHLYHPSKQHYIELHWKLFSFQTISDQEMESLVAQNLTETEFAGRKFTVLSKDLNLLYLVIHGGLHSWRRLKWLIDIHEIAKKQLFDETGFRELVAKMKAGRLVALCNTILEEFFPGGQKLPQHPSCPRFLVSHSLTMINNEMNEEYRTFKELTAYFNYLFRAFPGFKYKMYMMKYLWNSLRDSENKALSPTEMLRKIIRPANMVTKRYLSDK